MNQFGSVRLCSACSGN